MAYGVITCLCIIESRWARFSEASFQVVISCNHHTIGLTLPDDDLKLDEYTRVT